MAEVGAKFEKKWGTNKIKSVSIYPRNTHVHGKLAIQKFYFVPPPYLCLLKRRASDVGEHIRHYMKGLDEAGIGEFI